MHPYSCLCNCHWWPNITLSKTTWNVNIPCIETFVKELVYIFHLISPWPLMSVLRVSRLVCWLTCWLGVWHKRTECYFTSLLLWQDLFTLYFPFCSQILLTSRARSGSETLESSCNIQELILACPWLEEDETGSILRCTRCQPEVKGAQVSAMFKVTSVEEKRLPKKHEARIEERKRIAKNNKRFQNLKKSLKRHLKDCHPQPQDKVAQSKSQEAGLAVARVAYTCLKEALPYSKFPKLLLTLNLCKVNIGNTNHSREFITNFLISVYKALRERLVKYMTTHSEKTGFLLPFSLVDDLATYQRKCRQFIMIIVPLSDSDELLGTVPLTALPIKSGGRTGQGLARTIKATIDDFGLLYTQLVSCTWDGAYIHESVGQHLSRLLDLPPEDVHVFYDPMHRGKLYMRINISVHTLSARASVCHLSTPGPSKMTYVYNGIRVKWSRIKWYTRSICTLLYINFDGCISSWTVRNRSFCTNIIIYAIILYENQIERIMAPFQ